MSTAATQTTQQAIVSARIAEHNAARADAANELAQRHGDRAKVEGDVERIEQQLPLEEQQTAKLSVARGEGVCAPDCASPRSKSRRSACAMI